MNAPWRSPSAPYDLLLARGEGHAGERLARGRDGLRAGAAVAAVDDRAVERAVGQRGERGALADLRRRAAVSLPLGVDGEEIVDAVWGEVLAGGQEVLVLEREVGLVCVALRRDLLTAGQPLLVQLGVVALGDERDRTRPGVGDVEQGVPTVPVVHVHDIALPDPVDVHVVAENLGQARRAFLIDAEQLGQIQ